jgi:hypothetical protein
LGGGGAHVSRPIAGTGIGSRPHPSHPIAGVGGWGGNRPGYPGNRPGYPGNQPGYGWGGYGYPWGAAAIGAGLAYQDCYYNYNGSCNGYAGGYYEGSGTSDAIEACAQRFRSYDRASRTYLSKKGKRVSCP